MPLFFKSKEEKQKELDARTEKHLARWLQNVEETIRRRTRRLNYVMEVERVTPDSSQEALKIFHNTFGHLVSYGTVLSGQVHQCNFCILIPHPSQNLILARFEIPIQIDWQASYVHKGSDFSTAGGWICQPRDWGKEGQMNWKFPSPVVGYYSGAVWTIKNEGGHICPSEGESTELVLYPFCAEGREAVTVASYLNSISNVVSLLNKWSKKSEVKKNATSLTNQNDDI